MAEKMTQVRVPIPIEYCYSFLHEVVNGVQGWNIIGANPARYTILYQRYGGTTSQVSLLVTLSPISADQTLMILTAENSAIVDPFGFLDKTLKVFWSHFEAGIPRLTRTISDEIERQVSAGFLCPTCGRQLPAGARFCSHDGTPIALTCAECGRANTPDAKFCSNCGKKLQDEL